MEGDDYTIGGEDQGGRPDELGKGEGSYGTDGHPRGRDPLGFGTLKKDYQNPDRSIKPTYKGGSPLRSEEANKITQNMPGKKEIITETFDKTPKKYDDEGGLLDENNLLAEDSNGN